MEEVAKILTAETRQAGLKDFFDVPKRRQYLFAEQITPYFTESI